MRAVGAAPVQMESHRLSWVVVVVTVLAITSSSLSALSLFHVLALQAEVEVLRSEVSRRREGGRDMPGESVRGHQTPQQQHDRSKTLVSNSMVLPKIQMDASGRQEEQGRLKKRSLGSETEQSVFQPFLQMIADSKRELFQKEFALEKHTSIPWQAGLKRGSALEEDQDVIVVKEEGYYFIYSQVEHSDPPTVTQVYYRDPAFAMGHIVIRMKKHVVGDESQHVVLYRCIQSTNVKAPYNTCFTGGIVKLDVGDKVELLIPRPTVNISLDGDNTFLGAMKLA